MTGNPVYLAHGGCDRSTEDVYSFATPDPTFAFVGGPCYPTLHFVIAFWIMIAFSTLLTSLFCIAHFDFDNTITTKAHGGCDRSAEDAYSPMATDPIFAFDGGPCCPTLDFVFDYVLHIVNFAILYLYTMLD
jgi:hypothetical protein